MEGDPAGIFQCRDFHPGVEAATPLSVAHDTVAAKKLRLIRGLVLRDYVIVGTTTKISRAKYPGRDSNPHATKGSRS